VPSSKLVTCHLHASDRLASPYLTAPTLVYGLVYSLLLFVGERGDQFLAEVRDIRDDAVPDEVESSRKVSEYVFEGFLGRRKKWCPSLLV
jgi:hypothetical protein